MAICFTVVHAFNPVGNTGCDPLICDGPPCVLTPLMVTFTGVLLAPPGNGFPPVTISTNPSAFCVTEVIANGADGTRPNQPKPWVITAFFQLSSVLFHTGVGW